MTRILRQLLLPSALFHRGPSFGKMFPYFVKGEIVKGFGRGSKDLGFPTANYPDDVTKNLPDDLACGVYCGWASVNDGEVHKMVLSVGYNPFYKNIQKSMETHILHLFDKELYGSLLKVCILHYLRPEMNFNSLDDLIEAIKSDIHQAKELLDSPEYHLYKNNAFFRQEP